MTTMIETLFPFLRVRRLRRERIAARLAYWAGGSKEAAMQRLVFFLTGREEVAYVAIS